MRRFLPMVAILLLALAALVWWFRPQPRAPTPVSPTAAAPRPPTVRAPASHAFLLPRTAAADDGSATGRFRGRVLSARDERPVPSPTLTLLHDGAAHVVAGAADGSFAFVPPAPGAYELLSITAAGHLPFSVEPGASPVALEARPGRLLDEITLYLEPDIERTGRVVDGKGAPIAAAEIALVDGGASFTSDQRGEFRFHAAAGAMLEARHPRYFAARATVGETSRTTVITLNGGNDASIGCVLAGRVVDPAGRPALDAWVTVEPLRDGIGERLPVARAATDPDGRFRFHLDGRERHAIEARSPGLAPARVEAACDARDLALQLRAGGVLRGTVSDSATGKRLSAFAVVLWPVIGPLERGPRRDVARIDAGGEYAVDGLAPGKYRATAMARGYAPTAEAEIEIPPSLTPVVRDFALARGAALRGRVVERESGAPIAGARVALEGSAAPDAPLPPLDGAVTDGDGGFRLGGLAPGLRSLLVAADGHHGRILGLNVTGDDAPPLTVELARVGPGEEPHVELVGIGAVLGGRGDALVIGQVLPGGGAAAAGLRPGDAILTVDGAEVTALGFGDAIQRIRGPEGSTVRLGVRRGDGVSDVAVARTRIHD